MTAGIAKRGADVGTRMTFVRIISFGRLQFHGRRLAGLFDIEIRFVGVSRGHRPHPPSGIGGVNAGKVLWI
jgi:hypothetical protein